MTSPHLQQGTASSTPAPVPKATQSQPGWFVARVAGITTETPRAHRILLDGPGWPGNAPGQHVDVRLTAADGYQATRSYSLASSGPRPRLELAVDKVIGGEVSPFLVDDLQTGDELEVGGPLGGCFVWNPPPLGSLVTGSPVQLIGAGSGVVPLIAMVRAHVTAGDATPLRLLYSVRDPASVFYRRELVDAAKAPKNLDPTLIYSRAIPDGWKRSAHRITDADLDTAVFAPTVAPRMFVCGGTLFVEKVIGWLLAQGHNAGNIRAERYGGS